MKVYLAARYESRLELCGIREQLQRAGYEITSRWLDGKHNDLPAQLCANDDLEDIDRADALVLFSNTALAPIERSMRGGKHVEFGYALARGKFIYLVGDAENVFHHVAAIGRHQNVEAFLAHWCGGPVLLSGSDL